MPTKFYRVKDQAEFPTRVEKTEIGSFLVSKCSRSGNGSIKEEFVKEFFAPHAEAQAEKYARQMMYDGTAPARREDDD